jgi:hypothetical protein
MTTDALLTPAEVWSAKTLASHRAICSSIRR